MKNRPVAKDIFSNQLNEHELLEMAILGYRCTGVADATIWVGPNPHSHGLRIKISNNPTNFASHDCFTLTLPNFEVLGKVERSIITTRMLDGIEAWCELNMRVIIDYSDYKISTDEFVERLRRLPTGQDDALDTVATNPG